MDGRRMGHYRLYDRIAGSETGEVHRGRDERSGSEVAVTLLYPGTIADEAARKRLRKEILAVSRLSHPHIAFIHELNTQDGIDFLVTEYVPGETLERRVADAPLPESEVIALGTQLVEILAAAHAHGICHRNLNPGNVCLMPDGTVKILGFGLGRVLPRTGEFSDRSGALSCRAPEQLRGENADQRADIWAVGVLLYALATGRRAFVQTELTTDGADPVPVPPGQINPALSTQLEHIILKCIEREPGRRFQSARRLLADLRALDVRFGRSSRVSAGRQRSGARWLPLCSLAALSLAAALLLPKVDQIDERLRAVPEARQLRSVAVMPFEYLPSDSDEEYFADGMTEALIDDLARISALKVISRTSVMRYKAARESPLQIGRGLDVDAVIRGSVWREGGRVGIRAELIEAATDRRIWAETYEKDSAEVMALPKEVARAVAKQIRIKLTPEAQTHLQAAPVVDPEAYRLYLRGRYHRNRYNPGDFKKGIEFLQQAVTRDPAHALSHATLASTRSFLPMFSMAPASESMPRARLEARRALEIDPNLGRSNYVLGWVDHFYEWDWEDAERRFQRAIRINPSDAEAHFRYALALATLGRFRHALYELERARQWDPAGAMTTIAMGWVHYLARDVDSAITSLEEAAEAFPSSYFARLRLGQAYEQAGRLPEAVDTLQESVELSGGTLRTRAALAHAYALAGEREQAARILEELETESRQQYVSPYWIAFVYSGLGATETAMEWLETAFRERDWWISFLNVEPAFDTLRDQPRFEELVQRLYFPKN